MHINFHLTLRSQIIAWFTWEFYEMKKQVSSQISAQLFENTTKRRNNYNPLWEILYLFIVKHSTWVLLWADWYCIGEKTLVFLRTRYYEQIGIIQHGPSQD